MVQLMWKTMVISQKTKHGITILSTNPTLDIYTHKESGLKLIICTPMFIVASFTIIRRQKQPKYLSTKEWINKMWVHFIVNIRWNIIQPQQGYSVTGYNMDEPEGIMPNEISQFQKEKSCSIPLVEQSNSQKQKVQQWLPWAGGKRKWAVGV